MRFGGQLFGEMFQDSRLADTCIATDLDVAVPVEGGVNGRHALMASKQHVADPVADV